MDAVEICNISDHGNIGDWQQVSSIKRNALLYIIVAPVGGTNPQFLKILSYHILSDR